MNIASSMGQVLTGAAEVGSSKPAEKLICSDEHLYGPILANKLFG